MAAKTKKLAVVGLCLVVFLAGAGAALYFYRQLPAPVPELYAIGITAPFSGGYAGGESIKKGITLALKENSRTDIVLHFEDSVCRPADAVAAVNKLVLLYQVDAIIGDVCSGATMAVAPIANSLEIPIVSPASTNPDISRAGEFVFRTVPSDTLQGQYGADMALAQGSKSLAVIYYGNPYSLGFLESMSEHYQDKGGTIVSSQVIDPEIADELAEALDNIDPETIDGLYLIGNKPAILAQSLPLIQESLGVELPIYGTEAMTSPTFLAEVDPTVTNLTVSAFPSGNEDFQARYREEYDEAVPLWTANAYDAMTAVIQAIEESEETGLSIKQALSNIEFAGVTGQIAFDSNGDVAGNYMTLQLENGIYRPLEQ